MPLPLSLTHHVQGLDDVGQLTHPSFAPAWESTNNTSQRGPDPTLLTGKNFLDKFRQGLSGYIERVRPHVYDDDATNDRDLVNAFFTPTSDDDEDQRFGIGPRGIVASKTSGRGDRASDWQLELNPWRSSGAFSAGDFKIGGNAGMSPSVFVSKGPFRVDAGYGFAPAPIPMGAAAPEAKPSKWAKLSVDFQPERGPQTPPEVTIDRAFESEDMRPYAPAKDYGAMETARDAAEKLVNDYREANPYWYRP